MPPTTRCKPAFLVTDILHPQAKPSDVHITNSQTAAGATSAQDDPLEKAEAAKEKKGGAAATEGMKGEEALDAAIGDDGPDPEVTSADDDPLEEAEAAKAGK